jgi:hypothetical protein
LNFRLLAGSSSIDKGALNTSTVPQDFDGQSRPQGSGVDTGAFEFISGATPINPTHTPTKWPTGQRAYLPLVLR